MDEAFYDRTFINDLSTFHRWDFDYLISTSILYCEKNSTRIRCRFRVKTVYQISDKLYSQLAARCSLGEKIKLAIVNLELAEKWYIESLHFWHQTERISIGFRPDFDIDLPTFRPDLDVYYESKIRGFYEAFSIMKFPRWLSSGNFWLPIDEISIWILRRF